MSKSDRVWFITGASSGFGRALAEAVISRGERAVVAARRGAALAELVAIDSSRVLAVPLDVTDASARKAAVAAALAKFGRIDVLANIRRTRLARRGGGVLRSSNCGRRWS